MHFKGYFFLFLCALPLTVSAQQKNRHELNRTALYISYSNNLLSKKITQAASDFVPQHITFDELPNTSDCTIPMNCSELGLETFIHPMKKTSLFLAVGARMQISKGTKLLGEHVKYENMASTFAIVAPLSIGFDIICKDRVLVSPAVGIELKYSTNYNEEYTRMGFSNYQIAKKFGKDDGINKLQYGIRGGIDFSGHIVTMGVHYTYYLNSLYKTYGSVFANESYTYYNVGANASNIQIKFGFLIGNWNR